MLSVPLHVAVQLRLCWLGVSVAHPTSRQQQPHDSTSTELRAHSQFPPTRGQRQATTVTAKQRPFPPPPPPPLITRSVGGGPARPPGETGHGEACHKTDEEQGEQGGRNDEPPQGRTKQRHDFTLLETLLLSPTSQLFTCPLNAILTFPMSEYNVDDGDDEDDGKDTMAVMTGI